MAQYIKVEDCIGQSVNKASQEVFDILQKWFEKLQDGMHIFTTPDPFSKKSFTTEEIDHVIYEIDRDFAEYESWRLGDGEHQYQGLPEFNRLCPAAKKAMVQELWELVQYQDTHQSEYIDGVEDGSSIPIFEMQQFQEDQDSNDVFSNMYVLHPWQRISGPAI